MLPLSLLKVAEDQPMLIELKNGDTYNGRLVSCNAFMNICLKDVICTSKNGDRFWKMPECYIRGNTIKYLRIPDEIIHQVAEDENENRRLAMRGSAPRGGGGRTSGGRFGRGDGSGRGRGSSDDAAPGGTSTGGRFGGRSGGRGSYHNNNNNNYNQQGRGGGGRGGGRGGEAGHYGSGRGGRGGTFSHAGRDGGGRYNNRPTST